MLPAFVELLVATGCRPNEVLALRWADIDILGDPPTVKITGTLIDHGRIAGTCGGHCAPHVPEDLAWVTPHSFRRTVATVVRDALGAELAQQQLSHAKLATTEAHYLQRQTRGPDVRAVIVAAESISCGRVAAALANCLFW